jgi:hypothetical protein
VKITKNVKTGAKSPISRRLEAILSRFQKQTPPPHFEGWSLFPARYRGFLPRLPFPLSGTQFPHPDISRHPRTFTFPLRGNGSITPQHNATMKKKKYEITNYGELADGGCR